MVGRAVVVLAMTLTLTSLRAAPVQGQARQGRIQASVTVVSGPLSPAVTDSLIVTAAATPVRQALGAGVRIVELPPVPPAQGERDVPRRRVAVEYVGT
ncbi:MAG TPA: hypothetical protein VD793_09405 [Gemmatimonadales bacterium]|nr:hypothetical protein [Gemmatimonadales bacterium]